MPTGAPCHMTPTSTVDPPFRWLRVPLSFLAFRVKPVAPASPLMATSNRPSTVLNPLVPSAYWNARLLSGVTTSIEVVSFLAVAFQVAVAVAGGATVAVAACAKEIPELARITAISAFFIFIPDPLHTTNVVEI